MARLASEMISIPRCTSQRIRQLAANSSNVMPCVISLDTFYRLQNIMNGVRDFPRHQKTCTAVCSISARNIGCNPSRVVTSTDM
jgi:hypothetical protein